MTRFAIGLGSGLLAMMTLHPLTLLIAGAAVIVLTVTFNSLLPFLLGAVAGLLTMTFFGGLIITVLWASFAIALILAGSVLFLRSERGKLGRLR